MCCVVICVVWLCDMCVSCLSALSVCVCCLCVVCVLSVCCLCVVCMLSLCVCCLCVVSVLSLCCLCVVSVFVSVVVGVGILIDCLLISQTFACMCIQMKEELKMGKGTLFRANSHWTKTLNSYFRMLGLPYLYETIGRSSKELEVSEYYL